MERREISAYLISLRYSALALNNFRKKQNGNLYWENRTESAKDLMFTEAFRNEEEIGWFMAHGVSYGVYLELANSGQNEAIRPTINQFVRGYYKEIKSLYAGI